MAERRRSGKLAVILHADVAGSTTLVQQDEDLAHERIQDTFRRFSDTIAKYHGHMCELRGDALLADFERASDAALAALAFQAEQAEHIAQLNDLMLPMVRVGIAMGEVIVADNTVTGAGVVLAQRVEQLAEPGGLCITGAIHEALPQRMPFVQANLGEQQVKGFDEPIRVYRVELSPGESIPPPAERDQPRASPKRPGVVAAVAAIVLVAAGGAAYWFKPWAPQEEPASVERMAFPLPDKPSVAVLPFDVLGDESMPDYLGDGLTNDLVTALSKFSNLFVVASQSSFAYKNKPVKVQTVSEELGVRYVLRGSVQKTTDELRINAQLIDALSGGHLWAERFDQQTSELLAIQDEIVESVVANLAIQVDAAERQRAKGKNTDNLEAYDYYLRADDIRFDWEEAANHQARQLLQKAIESDPGYARAYSALAWTHVNDWRWDWSDDPEASKKSALEAAREAVRLDRFDAEGYHALGVVHLYSREFDKAIPLYEKAIALNPNDARRLVGTAPAWIYIGRTRDAVAQIERALRLNPHHSDNDLNFLAWAYYEAKEYEKALATLKKIDKSPWRSVLAVTYLRLGRLDEARAEVTALLKNDPEYSIERGEFYPYKDKEQWRHYYDALEEAGVPEHPLLKLPDKPSIAVLPFANMSSDPEQEYLSDGISENIITELSRFQELFVISRHSSFSYRGAPVKVQRVGKELGVRYVLEGSVQTSGEKLRVTAQLIDATTGEHLWAERFDRTLEDLFVVQDEITRTIVATLTERLEVVEYERTKSAPPGSLSAYQNRRRGQVKWLTFTKEGNEQARQLYERARELDPDYANAYAGLAWVYINGYRWGWVDNMSREESLTLAFEMARKAVELEPYSHEAHWALANALMQNGQLEQSISEYERALNLNPNDASLLAESIEALVYAGRAQEAVKHAKNAIRLNPYHPDWYLWSLGWAQYFAEDYEAALASLMKMNKMPNLARRTLAAIYVRMGRLEEAQAVIAELLENAPDYTLEKLQLNIKGKFRKSDEDRYIEDIRKAGLPD